MTKARYFTLAYRSHELHTKRVPFINSGKCKSWDEACWYFLFLWGML